MKPSGQCPGKPRRKKQGEKGNIGLSKCRLRGMMVLEYGTWFRERPYTFLAMIFISETDRGAVTYFVYGKELLKELRNYTVCCVLKFYVIYLAMINNDRQANTGCKTLFIVEGLWLSRYCLTNAINKGKTRGQNGISVCCEHSSRSYGGAKSAT